MIKRRAFYLIILSLVMGSVAAYVANNWIQMQMASNDKNQASDSVVVVAAMKIPFGHKIEGSHIKLIKMPEDSIPGGSISDIKNVEGKITRQVIYPGEIINKNRIAKHIGGSTLAAIIEPKKRAITVRVNDVVGVAGFLLPENRVDVLASKKIKKKVITDTVLKDIKVLAVDQTASTDKNEPVIVRAVTLEMTPAQAEQVVKATQEGRLQLTLRNPMDKLEKVVVKAKPKAKPVKKVVRVKKQRSRTSRIVTIIRGKSVERTKAKL